MIQKKRAHPKIKTRLHPRNKHRERYDFKQLIETCPELAQFVKLNQYNDESIDFSDPEAVKMLNTALLQHFYKIKHWNVPPNYLSPPIPGRADYIHHIAELLAGSNNGKIPTDTKIKCLDVGVGASCIYPIIGNKEYGWSFVGSDIDPVSIESAQQIVDRNPSLKGKIELRLQHNPNEIFRGIIKRNEIFDVSICNPPFHASLAEAKAANLRKLSNLNRKKITKPGLNIWGQSKGVWGGWGGEKFVGEMDRPSKTYATSCFWFSTLISKQSLLKRVYDLLDEAKVSKAKTIHMGQGNKSTQIVAWTFLTREQLREWTRSRWSWNTK